VVVDTECDLLKEVDVPGGEVIVDVRLAAIEVVLVVKRLVADGCMLHRYSVENFSITLEKILPS